MAAKHGWGTSREHAQGARPGSTPREHAQPSQVHATQPLMPSTAPSHLGQVVVEGRLRAAGGAHLRLQRGQAACKGLQMHPRFRGTGTFAGEEASRTC